MAICQDDREWMNSRLRCGDLHSAWDVYYRNRCVWTDEFWQEICRIASEGDPSFDDHKCWTRQFWNIANRIYCRIEEEEKPDARIATLLAEMFKNGRKFENGVRMEIFSFIRKVYRQHHVDDEARDEFFRTIMVNDNTKEVIFFNYIMHDELSFRAYVNKLIGSGSMTKSANKN